ncbi:MAG: hypothetical protein NTX16_15290 [Actinobacteria bacterium]|nr:hypothetical protein [Actinomycetota bacterium]
MIWAILAILGVPLWVIAGGIAYMILLNRHLRHREGDMPVRARYATGKRWRRGHAVWVGDVFAYRSSPSSWNESLDLVRSATLRELTVEEAHALRRLDGPIVAVLSTDGHAIEVAAAGSQKDALLGPFAAERNEKG